jgi:hypothetical protein
MAPERSFVSGTAIVAAPLDERNTRHDPLHVSSEVLVDALDRQSSSRDVVRGPPVEVTPVGDTPPDGSQAVLQARDDR